MKSKILKVSIFAVLLSLACVPALLLSSCGGTTVNPSPSPSPSPAPAPAPQPISQVNLTLIQTGATIATGTVLSLVEKTPAERTQLANQIYASGTALYKLTGGQVPTPQDFNGALSSYGISGVSQYTQYVTAIDAVYASYYQKYTAGSITSQNILAVINALAAGADAGASAYITLPPPAPATAFILRTDIRCPFGSSRYPYDLAER